MTTTDRRLLLLGPDDNCLIVCEPLTAGAQVLIDGQTVTISKALPIGHKVARHDLTQGQVVYRYGAAIGSMKEAAKRGEHLHTHNMKSDYIPTYTLQSGQQFVTQHAAH